MSRPDSFPVPAVLTQQQAAARRLGLSRYDRERKRSNAYRRAVE